MPWWFSFTEIRTAKLMNLIWRSDGWTIKNETLTKWQNQFNDFFFSFFFSIRWIIMWEKYKTINPTGLDWTELIDMFQLNTLILDIMKPNTANML